MVSKGLSPLRWPFLLGVHKLDTSACVQYLSYSLYLMPKLFPGLKKRSLFSIGKTQKWKNLFYTAAFVTDHSTMIWEN